MILSLLTSISSTRERDFNHHSEHISSHMQVYFSEDHEIRAT